MNKKDSVVQGLWIGSRLSVMEQLSIASFIKHGHEYHLYTYEEVEGIPKGAILKSADEIISQMRIFEYKDYTTYSNIFRYKLLLERGGYWADTDVICSKPFDFESDYVFGLERMRDRSISIGSAVIKAPVSSEIMRFCYDYSSHKYPDKLVWGEIGPIFFTEAVKRYGLSSYVLPYETFYPIDWWDWKDIISGKLGTRIKVSLQLTRKVYAIHLWNEMWRNGKIDKNGTHHPSCLFEKLKKIYLAP